MPLRADIADPFLGRVLGDRYRILERIGAGGMGQVYRAAHARIACTFAVKVVWGDIAFDPAVQARFVREAEVASCLQSRWIVRVVDFSSDLGGVPYLVMEFLDGPTLHDVLTRERVLPVARAVRIVLRIALGLAHAHERGVVHRDLKPENVMLTIEDDDEDVVKLLDFGVARRDDAERLTSSGMALGTPLYMSPEQIKGEAVDGRSDLYALGVLLVEMLTGRSPFDAPTLEGTMRKHLTEPPPSVREELDACAAPAGLDDVVQRLLAKRPGDRFDSARAFVQALAEVMAPPPRSSLAPLPPRRSAVPLDVLTAVEGAIRAGAPLYNAGDHAGCLGLYRHEAERLAEIATAPAAVAARLRAGVARAAGRSNPTDAAWDLRHAFDDLIFAGPVGEAAADPLAQELAALDSVSARSVAEGRLDLLAETHLAFGRELAGRLRHAYGDEPRARWLEAATASATRAGGGMASVVALEPALRALPTAPTSLPPASVTAPPSGTARTGLAVGRLDAELRERILRAIRVGAPAFNEGRHDVCVRVYEEAAREIATRAEAMPSAAAVEQYLKRALAEAASRTATDGAWVLRHAFDGLLALD